MILSKILLQFILNKIAENAILFITEENVLCCFRAYYLYEFLAPQWAKFFIIFLYMHKNTYECQWEPNRYNYESICAGLKRVRGKNAHLM